MVLELNANVASTFLGGLGPAAKGTFSWSHNKLGGVYQDACHPEGEYAYAPLFHLKKYPSWLFYRDGPGMNAPPLAAGESHE